MRVVILYTLSFDFSVIFILPLILFFLNNEASFIEENKNQNKTASMVGQSPYTNKNAHKK